MAIGIGHPTFTLSELSIAANAPNRSGVYAICNQGGAYVYFGESNDIQRRLQEHLNDSAHCMHARGAVTFAFDEVAGQLARTLAQNDLIRRFPTPCNQMMG